MRKLTFCQQEQQMQALFDFVSFTIESSCVCVLQINKHRLFSVPFPSLKTTPPTTTNFGIHHCYDVSFFFFVQIGITNELGIMIAVSYWRKDIISEIYRPTMRIDICIFAQLHPGLSTRNK